MADRSTIRENLLKELNTLPVHNKTADNKEISIRCPNCGDSRKSAKSSHLYINIDPESDKFLQYYCFRCRNKGLVGSDFLKSLKIRNQELVIDINTDLKHSKRIKRSSLSIDKRKKYARFPSTYESTKENLLKLQYINNRLGTHLTMKDLKDYKIILSLYDFLELNRVKKLTCKERLGDTLDANFLGFVSYDNNYVVLRNLSKKIMTDTRYYNYNIYNNYDNTKKFYIIPTKMNILAETITVVLTEGIFDILSVYFNIEQETRENKLFVAVCGIGYNAVLQEIIRMGFLRINLKIYADADQNISLYKSLKTEFSAFIARIEVFTNSKSKDFGDVRKGIEIRRTLL